MAIFPCGSAIQPAAAGAGGGFYDYPINQSLRFNDDDSAYLSWTPASTGSRQVMTLSFWAKRGNVPSAAMYIWGTGDGTTSNRASIQFNTDNTFSLYSRVSGGTTYGYTTSMVFRDPSAWYHIVVQIDTTEGAAADRGKIWVNGTQAATTLYNGGFPSSYNTYFNLNKETRLGCANPGSGSSNPFFDGYMAEVHFIDGQALDPTSFGETVSGVWKPIAYSGSYGTNGFYLDFADSADIGSDESGNGNDWTINSLAATDVVLDSPTNNFATLNPLARNNGTVPNLSEGNLSWSTNVAVSAYSNFGMSSGKWYWETRMGGTNYALAIAVNNYDRAISSATTNTVAYVGIVAGVVGTNSTISYNNYSSFASGDIIGMALDVDNKTLDIYKNNTLILTFDTFTLDAPYFFSGDRQQTTTHTHTLNFGQDSSFAGNKIAQGNTDDNGIGDFYYAPPTGYLALCTANLTVPDAMNPALDNSPQDHFNTVLYTGDATDDKVISVGFPSDLIWIKQRSGTRAARIFDRLRGTDLSLYPSSTNGDNTDTDALSSFDADGFTLDYSGSVSGFLNQSGETYVAWNWKANGSGVSNTDGSITSTVSANTDAGFSIVSYTADGTFSNVGHGLNQTPELWIGKRTDSTGNWIVGYTVEDGTYDVMTLNTTNASSDYSSTGYPTSTTVPTVGTPAASSMIQYCFHSVEGFSKFGSYTGNGSADGPFVYCGFRPAFLLVKRTNAAADWQMFDNRRPAYNEINESLEPNNSVATQTHNIDFLSNGFKIRANQNVTNYSGSPIIYMAFAEQPFAFANAR